MKSIITVIFSLIILNSVMGQTPVKGVISSSGSSFSNSTYQLDWSLGGLTNSTFQSGDYVLTGGFQSTTLEILGIENLTPSIKISIFPNPTSAFINIKLDGENYGEMEYTILNSTGKELNNERIKSSTERIDFTDYSTGIYIVNIEDHDSLIRTIKVMKK